MPNVGFLVLGYRLSLAPRDVLKLALGCGFRPALTTAESIVEEQITVNEFSIAILIVRCRLWHKGLLVTFKPQICVANRDPIC